MKAHYMLLKIQIISICLYLISTGSTAQSNTKYNLSKEETIVYLNDKLNQNCIGIAMRKESYFSDYTVNYYEHTMYDNYLVKDLYSKTCNIYIDINSIVRKSMPDNPSENYTRTSPMQIIVPIEKIQTIDFSDVSYTKNEKGGFIEESFGGIYLLMVGSGNNFSIKDIERGTLQHFPAIAIPINEKAEGEKIKKAILHLQTFFKSEKDPFEN
jgi:hypothetical protein